MFPLRHRHGLPSHLPVTAAKIRLQNTAATSKQNTAAIQRPPLSPPHVSPPIPPLVSVLINGSSRGKKDVMTTLYKLCSVNLNKERAVSAGMVRPLIDLAAEQGSGMAEKAMVVLSIGRVVEFNTVRSFLERDPKSLLRISVDGHDRVSALHLAASSGQIEILSMLLDYGANPDLFNRHKQTPLTLDAMHGKISCLEKLIQAGANVGPAAVKTLRVRTVEI